MRRKNNQGFGKNIRNLEFLLKMMILKTLLVWVYNDKKWKKEDFSSSFLQNNIWLFRNKPKAFWSLE